MRSKSIFLVPAGFFFFTWLLVSRLVKNKVFCSKDIKETGEKEEKEESTSNTHLTFANKCLMSFVRIGPSCSLWFIVKDVVW